MIVSDLTVRDRAMPTKRKTHGLTACTEYTLRLCDKNGGDPCDYHSAVDESKRRGITLRAYIDFKEIQDAENEKEK